MFTRKNTKSIKIKDIVIGGQNKVLIQSMCDIKTSNFREVIKQIHDLENMGVDLMRVSVMDEQDALAIKEIVNNVNVPIVADIHFDYKLALLAIENGAHKIRINPGNIGNEDNLVKVINAAKEKGIAIRIGVNSGSSNYKSDKAMHLHLFDLAKEYVELFEKHDFKNIVVSIKGSNVIDTIKANQLFAESFDYPIHLGITEAGTKDISLIRSSAGLSPLLLSGIGDTIRISICDSPSVEITACKRLLNDLGLYPNYPSIITCPTCGRTQVNLKTLADKLSIALEYVNKPITVALMGCAVNGPGEARHADIGIAGGKQEFLLFKKGEIIKKIPEQDVFEELICEINKL